MFSYIIRVHYFIHSIHPSLKMPSLAAPLKKWIADCKAYAAKHGCSYKEAMTALKKSRKRGHSQHGGGGVADSALSLEGFALGKEGNQNMGSGAAAGGHSEAGGANNAAVNTATAAGAPPPPPPPPGNGTSQVGGQPMFEAGAVAQSQSGGRRRRRSRESKRKSRSHSRSHSRSRSQSRSQSGGKRRRSQRQRHHRSSRGGSGSLSYSQY